jgi:RNA polymerase sigma-70 factor (ECF subfamily)
LADALTMTGLKGPIVQDDDALDRHGLRATALRDREQFEQLYRRYHQRLGRFLRRYTTRRDLIDDVVNDTMWIVWRKAGEFRGESRVSTWISGIAYRCMLKALRGAGPAHEASEPVDAHDGLAHPEPAHGEARELNDWVASGLRSLPEEQRMTLELAYFFGHSCEEIAEVMGCAVGTVKSRMFHARVRLRHVLPGLGGTPAPDPQSAQG